MQSKNISRRNIAKGAAWSAPALTAAIAAPMAAASASAPTGVAGQYTGSYYWFSISVPGYTRPSAPWGLVDMSNGVYSTTFECDTNGCWKNGTSSSYPLTNSGCYVLTNNSSSPNTVLNGTYSVQLTATSATNVTFGSIYSGGTCS